MTFEKRDGILWVDILWDDLSAAAQLELWKYLSGNGNFDVFPLASINISPEDEEVNSNG